MRGRHALGSAAKACRESRIDLGRNLPSFGDAQDKAGAFALR
jgi:hypothetical protein